MHMKPVLGNQRSQYINHQTCIAFRLQKVLSHAGLCRRKENPL